MATPSAHSATAHGDAHPEGPSALAYFVIFVILLILLFASVGVAYIRIEKGDVRTLLTAIGFTIATVKALLIILYFMHVKFSSRLTWLFSLGSFFFLLIMVALTMNDYATRVDVVRDISQMSGPVEPSGVAEGYRGPVAPSMTPRSEVKPEK